ncbi:MAG: DUF4386 family protein [Hyphomicrobiaceae bacterium]|nr:DUF4386 family protein [Hyphomicrobiaceae bacterium]MCC0024230.1 DUF4386 family protein [Hyphomicrobiaceae bacterium]
MSLYGDIHLSPTSDKWDEQMQVSRRMVGAAAIVLALLFNLAYGGLAAMFNYPAILRQPATEVLAQFSAGGPVLILVWYGFALSALLLVPLAPLLAGALLGDKPFNSIGLGLAITGALAGALQGIGLARWVFVVPALAAGSTDPAGSAGEKAVETVFVVLNAYGGVAIGEHLGQLMTVLFLLFGAAAQWRPRGGLAGNWLPGLAALAAFLVAAGTGEGLALVLGGDTGPFGLITTSGFLVLSLWLVATGIGLLLSRPRQSAAI